MRRHARELGVTAVLLAILATLALVAPAFYQTAPLRSLLAREAPTLVVACGMALVIIGRQIDISVGSQFSVCSVAAGLLAAAGWPTALAVAAAVAIGALWGAINGALVAGLGLPSIVVTLATMVTLRQGLNLARQGEFVNLPDQVQWLGLSQTAGQTLILLVAGAVLVGLAWALRSLAAGRHIYAVGSDAEAARLAGLRPRRVTFAVFLLLGALTGLAAAMNLIQSPQVQPLVGSGLELKVIAAVVIGGVAISGGRGQLWGVLAGLLLLAVISPALTHLRIEAYWEKAIQGAIILLAVVTEGLRRRAGGKGAG
ncbi:MAG: ABC transporter permease [Verrucomicrobia bacterium]|nr:ABC transporter permease [Verrucomicrobiota bacterium]